MKFVQLPVLLLARIWPLHKIAKNSVRRAAPVRRGSYSAEATVFPLNIAAAFTKTVTTALVKYFIPLENVKKNASAHVVER